MGKAIRNSDGREIWGVLGGLGPLASAEFLRTIYKRSAGHAEQAAPVVILLSDPRMPDRTSAILRGEEQLLLRELSKGLDQLLSFGATQLIVCCVTLHRLLTKIPIEVQRRTVSLVDIIFSLILHSSKRHLLICTEGAREQRVFEEHAQWNASKKWIVCPDAEEQKKIHEMLYQIKCGQFSSAHIHYLKLLQSKYDVNSYIAGCTEAHIIVNEQERLDNRPSIEFCIDPLQEIASRMSVVPLIGGAPTHRAELDTTANAEDCQRDMKGCL